MVRGGRARVRGGDGLSWLRDVVVLQRGEAAVGEGGGRVLWRRQEDSGGGVR